MNTDGLIELDDLLAASRDRGWHRATQANRAYSRRIHRERVNASGWEVGARRRVVANRERSDESDANDDSHCL